MFSRLTLRFYLFLVVLVSAVLFGLLTYAQYVTNRQVSYLRQTIFTRMSPTATVTPVIATPSATLAPTKAFYKYAPAVTKVLSK